MPSFTKECLERWRDERISSTDISDHLYSNPKALRDAIEIAKSDLEEEEYRLRIAQNNVEFSEMNIDSLKNKLKKLMNIVNSQNSNKD